MTNTDKKIFEAKLEIAYRSMMSSLYVEFKHLKPYDIKLTTLKWITNHILSKLNNSYYKIEKRKKKRIIKRKKQIEAKQEIIIKNQLDNFLMDEEV